MMDKTELERATQMCGPCKVCGAALGDCDCWMPEDGYPPEVA